MEVAVHRSLLRDTNNLEKKMRIRMVYLVAILLLNCATAISSPIPADTTLDFEGIADGTILNSLGTVTFTGAAIATAGETLNEYEVPPRSGNNAVLNLDPAMTLIFTDGVYFLSGYITYGSKVDIWIQNASGTLAHTRSLFDTNLAISGETGSTPNEFFSFRSTELITGLTLSADFANAFALDDVSFSSIPLGTPSEVPLPGSLQLLLVGALSMLLARQAISWRRITALAAGVVLVGAASAQSTLPELTVYPSNIPAGSTKTVTATLTIADAGYVAGSALLNEVDANNKIVRRLGSLVDDGTGGDDTPGDKRYTVKFKVSEATPRLLRVAASIALKGSLTRTASPSALLWITEETDSAQHIAVVTDKNVLFKDADGNTLSTLPLAQFQSYPTDLLGSPAVETATDIAYASESQSRVGIFTSRLIKVEQEHEGAALPSHFRYFNADGALQFQTTSPPLRTYFTDPQLLFTSRSGHRLILVDVAEHDTTPVVRYLDDKGNVLRTYSELPELAAITEARLSSDGRYVAIVGNGTTNRGRQITVLVIDTATDNITLRRFDELSTFAIGVAENQRGTFNLIEGEQLGEQLP